MEHMLSIKLDWNDFVKFKALHVIGLLLLRSVLKIYIIFIGRPRTTNAGLVSITLHFPI